MLHLLPNSYVTSSVLPIVCTTNNREITTPLEILMMSYFVVEIWECWRETVNAALLEDKRKQDDSLSLITSECKYCSKYLQNN